MFARSFPDYNPQSYALFKYKAAAQGCGRFTEEEIAQVELSLQDSNKPPYAFERGEHLDKVEELGLLSNQQCIDQFEEHILNTLKKDVILAYIRYGKNCGDMMVEEGLMDRDLGQKDYDDEMKDFVNQYLAGDMCKEGCTNSDLAQQVDVDNFLKTLAFYASTLNMDSVISWLNNFYLAQTGDGKWKLVAYDLNAPINVVCNTVRKICDERFVHWSIARPTCESLEENPVVGPLLSDPELHQKYLEYVNVFVGTIYNNASLIQEVEDHLKEIDPCVRKDFWAFYGAFYDDELSPDTVWNSGFGRIGYAPPLLPLMKARGESLQEQLAAIADGTYPRGPHVGSLGDNEPWEACADWRLSEPNRSACEQECRYEGCHMPGWAIESFCDEGFGSCYHGEADARCAGIPDHERYVGMENTTDGRETWCQFAKGVPVRTADCPVVGAFSGEESSSSAVKSRLAVTTRIFMLSSLVGYLLA